MGSSTWELFGLGIESHDNGFVHIKDDRYNYEDKVQIAKPELPVKHIPETKVTQESKPGDVGRRIRAEQVAPGDMGI